MDVAWDAPEHAIDPRDPRWELGEDDLLGATDWYRSQPADRRARLGLHRIAGQMRLGFEFENVLSRGLLELAMSLPPRAAELRYALHEVIEEGQHSLMFNEFVRRTGLPVRGLSPFETIASRRVTALARSFPEMFLVHVLGGEAPIDRVQRRALESEHALHPLQERIMRIHILEEARHVCFAKEYLRAHVPELGTLKRWRLSVATPVVLGVMANQMLRLPSWLARAYGVPAAVLNAAYGTAAHRHSVLDCLEPVRSLAVELGLVTPSVVPLWRLARIWPSAPDAARRP